MEITLPSRQTPASAKEAYKLYKSLDNQIQDSDPRQDFVTFTQGEQKVEVALTPAGFLARQTEANQVTVTNAQIPRWVGKAQVDTICRTAQGAYSGFLGGVEIAPDPAGQDRARQVFFEWQRPLQKQGDDCGG